MNSAFRNPKSAFNQFGWSEAVGLALLIGVVLVVALPGPDPSFPVQAGCALLPLQVDDWLNVDDAESPVDRLSGRLVVVDCWATWCPACREAMPRLAHLFKQYGPLGVEFIGLTPEPVGDRAIVATYVDSVDSFHWPVGMGADPTLDRYGVSLLPTLILFGTNGRAIWSGDSIDKLAEQLDLALVAL